MSIKEKLEQEEKVKVRLPKDPLNPEILTKRVFINGYAVEIALGKTVSVPQSIYDVLERTGQLG